MTVPAWLDPALDVDERVDALLADLSPEEAAAVALSEWSVLESRGLPKPHYVDAGSGLRDVDGATAFPVGISLAASFDAALAEEYGRAVGEETRTAGFTVLLGPTLDLARDPRGGRVPEAFGEDPHLASVIGAAHVRGAQSARIICQLKHFAAYNGESRRTGHGPLWSRGDAVDVEVSWETMHDVYLRPFRAAFDAGAWSFMGSYNRIGGHYACELEDLMRLPSRSWGWRGFSCPDFMFAVRDDAKALAAGLDVGALDGPGRRTPAMIAAAPTGTAERIAGNVVRALIGSGAADDPVPAPSPPSTPEHREVARRTAVRGTVLLANDGVLPLAPDVRSVALIGPAGTDFIMVGGGAAAVAIDPARAVTPRQALEDRLGSRLHAAQGTLGDIPLPLVPPEAFTLPDGSGPGVLVERVAADGSASTEVVPVIDEQVPPDVIASSWPRRWRTRLISDVTGRHRLSLALGGRAVVRVDGDVLLAAARETEQFVAGPHYPVQAVLDLVAGEPVALDIEFEVGPSIIIPPLGVLPVVRLGWQRPDSLIDDAVAAAAAAEVAVVLVQQVSGEGMDRDALALPGDQDDLVARVAAANPRTVVVLNTGGPVAMPWLDDVAAVLQVWFPGEQAGEALADVLLGVEEAGGRLPMTFPLDVADLPGGDRVPGDDPLVLRYDEAAAIGYRSAGVRSRGALFPFGHGLQYGPTSARVLSASVSDAGCAHVVLEVSGPSSRDAVHIAQAYAELSGSRGDRELVGVVRIPVDAGQTALGQLDLPASAFARYDEAAGDRVPVPGRHLLRVAVSSDDPGEVLVVTVADGRVASVARP